MKAKLATTLLGMLAAVAALVSCSDRSDIKPVSGKDFMETPELFAYAKSRATGAVAASEGAHMAFVFTNDYRTADVYMYDFRLPGSADTRTYVFTSVPWDFSIGTRTVERVIECGTLSADATMGDPLTVDDARMVFFQPNDMDRLECRGFYMKFTCGGEWDVTVLPVALYCGGTTEVAKNDSGVRNYFYDSVLEIVFSPETLTADLLITNLPLSDGSVLPYVSLPGVSFSITDDGYTLEARQSVDAGEGVRVEGFHAEAVFGDELVAEFTLVDPSGTRKIRQHLESTRFSTPVVQTD